MLKNSFLKPTTLNFISCNFSTCDPIWLEAINIHPHIFYEYLNVYRLGFVAWNENY